MTDTLANPRVTDRVDLSLLTCRGSLSTDGDFHRSLFIADRMRDYVQAGWGPGAAALCEVQYQGFMVSLQDRKTEDHETEDQTWLLAHRPVARLILTHVDSDIRIVSLAVEPEHRGRGIARAVLEPTQAWADVCGRTVSLHVDPLNLAALALYESLGFHPPAASSDPAIFPSADLCLVRTPRRKS